MFFLTDNNYFLCKTNLLNWIEFKKYAHPLYDNERNNELINNVTNIKTELLNKEKLLF